MNKKPVLMVNIVYAIIFLAIAAFLLYSTRLDYLVEGRPLFPQQTQDKSAVYVRFLALSLGGFSILMIINSFWRPSKMKLEAFTAAPKKIITLVSVLIIYISLIHFIGFFPASIIYLPISMYILGYRNIFSIALTTMGLLLFVYFIFVTIFAVPLPDAALF